jgi:uncharacterized protein YjiK
MPVDRVSGSAALSSRGDVGPARFKPVDGAIVTGLKEASDVVALPDGRFLVVGDLSDSAALIGKNGRVERLKLEGVRNHHSGLEGVTYDPQKKRLFVASEEKGEILRYDWDAGSGKAPRLDKTFEVKGFDDKNKGIEGMAWLSGDASPTGTPKLLVVKEGQPRQLGLLDDKGGGKADLIELDDALKDVCKDFSGIASDPVSGHLFIASDESSVIAEVKLKKKHGKLTAELVQAIPLRDPDDKKIDRVEGLTFDARGNLFVCLENASKLIEYKRK